MAKIKICETVLRDSHQSLIATRMTTEEMLPILEKMDEVGYYSLEAWGGATFDSCLRFLNEDPLKNWHRKTGYLFSVWGHTHEFTKPEDWERIEKLFKLVSGRDDVWYPTTIELYNYVKAYESLSYSIDMKTVYNPSAFDIWISKDGRVIKLDSGKETVID